MSERIVVIGSNMVDLVTTIDRMPEPGETLAAPRFAMGNGGKGANQAVAAARLGATVSMVTCVGDDVFGGATRNALAGHGIDVAHVRTVADTASGVAPIFVSSDGENRILIVKGANAALSPADIDRADGVVTGAALVMLQLEIELETVYHAIERAHALGVPVLLNPAPATRALALDRIRSVAFFAPNQTELAILTGLPTGTAADAAAAARTLVDAGIGTVLVTLGADGVLVVTGRGVETVPAIRVEAVDTTGAGDAFLGAFAFRYVTEGGGDLAALCRFAAAYAAHSVTGHGTQSAFADAATFARFRAERGIA